MKNRIIDADVWVGDCHLLDGRYDVSDREEACDAIKHFAHMVMMERETYLNDTIGYLLDELEAVVDEEKFKEIEKRVLGYE